MRFLAFLPAVLAALTDFLVVFYVRAIQPRDYPDRVVIFQVFMFAAALLVAVPDRWARATAFALLGAGVFVTGFSVGVFYIPTVVVAAWVVSREPAGHAG
jgi:multisubunit Na+/H+ antiporter MnhF subunit